MQKPLLSTAPLILFWLISPDALVIAGNSVGKGGWLFLVPLSCGFLVTLWAASILAGEPTQNSNSPANSDNHNKLIDSKQRFPSALECVCNILIPIITLASCFSTALMIPTGTLVTAGFTFNETFLYWFPNFGFSYLLLGTIVMAHICSTSLPQILQKYLFILTCSCLLILSFVGILGGPSNGSSYLPIGSMNWTEPELFIQLLSFSLLLFLGFDQALGQGVSFRQRFIVLFFGGLLIAAWCYASILHVDNEKLANTTIPYIIGAREIMGQPGRILMGIAIISGACAVVNGLLIYTRHQLSATAVSFDLPIWLNPNNFQRIYGVTIGVIIGVLMAIGLAGEDTLETMIFGSLLCWLLLISVRILALQVHNAAHLPQKRYSLFVLPLLLMIIFIYSVFSHTEQKALLQFLALTLTGSTAVGTVWILLGKKTAATSRQK